jgi:hypothetical protein
MADEHEILIDDEYKVKVKEETGCKHCGAGTIYLVVDSEDVARSITFGSEGDARDLADAMNVAFHRGRASGLDTGIAAIDEVLNAGKPKET